MKYRIEIDGLRALAVLSVSLFHFFPSTIDYGFNGYLGVDVFFVISGFLIGQYIILGLNQQTFSFKQFYMRRVKRILPAAIFVLFVTTLCSIFILTTYDLNAYFESLVFTIAFVPNVYFWRTGGYFGDLDALKPLLHYWSLGVEEQFYLFFPVFIFVAFKILGKRYITHIVLAVVVFSLALNYWLESIGGANPAFFLLPTRIWEFGLGVLAGQLSQRSLPVVKHWRTNLFFALLGACFFVPQVGNVPIALPIVVLTAAFLASGHSSESISYSILANPVATFFGKISFSMYLFHWPIVVFLSYVFVDSVPAAYLLSSIVIVVLLSYLSFKFVEEPFRHRFSTGVVVWSCVSLVLVMLGLAAIGLNSNKLNFNNSTLVNNLSAQIQTNYRCPISTYQTFEGSRACHLKGNEAIEETNLILLGNSHAQMYAPIVRQNERVANAFLVPVNSCLPTTQVNISKKCMEIAQLNFAAISKLTSLDTVVISMTWFRDVYYTDEGPTDRHGLLQDLLRMIKDLESRDIRVFVASPIPTPQYNHASEFSRKLKFGLVSEEIYLSSSKVPYSEFYDQIAIFDQGLSAHLGPRYLKLYEQLCDSESCYFGDVNGSYYSDGDHVSVYGLERLSAAFGEL